MDRPNKDGKHVASVVGEYVNSLTFDPTDFVETMANEHRTLQQSFTKLCFAWIQRCAAHDYRHDLRNEYSVKKCQEIIEHVDLGSVPFI